MISTGIMDCRLTVRLRHSVISLWSFFAVSGSLRKKALSVFILCVWCLGLIAGWSATALSAGQKSPRIRLFGTLEFRGPLKTVPVWLNVIKRNQETPLFVPGTRLNSSTTWDEFKAKAEKLPLKEQLKMVNRFWNQWPYREDRDLYKKSDYWAIPKQFCKTSGDCEDYAIAKYFMLRALGVPAEKMRIVVLMETIRNVAHAILVVYADGDAFVLDNLSNNVLSHTRYRSYVPQFSVNEQYRWAHVRPK